MSNSDKFGMRHHQQVATTLSRFLALGGAAMAEGRAEWGYKFDDYLSLITDYVMRIDRLGFRQELVLQTSGCGLPALLIKVDVPDTNAKLLIGAYFWQCFNAGSSHAFSDYLLEQADLEKVESFSNEHFDLEFSGQFNDSVHIGFE